MPIDDQTSLRFSASEEQFRTTLDSLLEGFQIIDFDWHCVYVNPAAAAQGRQPAEKVTGRLLTEAYPGVERTPIFDAFKRSMDEREVVSIEAPYTFSDGTTRWFEIRVQPVPEGICVHSVDIQARKDAEAAQATLLQQERVAHLGEMAALIAHEVKNPLASLAGALQLLRGRRPADDPERAIFTEMLDRIGALDRLMRDLLVLARPVKIDRQRFPLAELIHDVVGLLESDPAVQRHDVSVSIGATPIVAGDINLLRTVLQNLVLNAAQAMTDEGEITIRLDRDRQTCRIAISDTGAGVPAEARDRIFEPFFTTKGGGTGLGLAISRRVMRLHGGDVRLDPGPPPGATFLLTLPVARE